MKNYLLLLLLFAGTTFTASAGNVTIASFLDSSFVDCPVPVTKDFIIFGEAIGYNANDSVTIHFFFGDGTDTITRFPIFQVNFFGYVSHNYTQPGFYTLQAIVTAPDGVADTAVITSVVADNCGNVSGKIYADNNLDCLFNTGDQVLENYKVILKHNGLELLTDFTNQLGEYSFSVPSGNTYEVEIANISGVVISCPTTGTHTISSFPAHNLDFALTCPASGFDLYGGVSSGFTVPGISTPVHFQVGNASCTPTDGVVMIVLSDSLITLAPNQALATAPDSTNGDTLYYSFSNLDLFNQYSFYLYVVGDTTLQIGDSACIEVHITPSTGDLNPANNSTIDCINVRTSYDPNMKEVYPMGAGTDGRVRPNTDLNYIIYFQNTGTYTASNVYILDTIDNQNLDMSTLQILEYSHPMELHVFEDNILRFNFNNIMLPDSNANEPQSHGYVTFTIKQKQNLSTGIVIHNSAAIYFDYNPPIITNSTVTTIDATLGVEENVKSKNQKLFDVYPNPAGDKITLKLAKHIEKGQVYIVDITGKIVFTEEINQAKQINVKHLPNGMYNIILRVENEQSQQKLIILH